MIRHLVLFGLIQACMLISATPSLKAQESSSAATPPAARDTTLSFNPIGLVLFPELRLLYESAIFDGSSSLSAGASLGSRYAIWGVVNRSNRFLLYDTWPRIGRVHAQVRKYRGQSFDGLYVAGEGRVSYMIESLNEFDFDRDTYMTTQERTLSTAAIAFGGWKHIAGSGLTYDLSLGVGVETNRIDTTFLIEPRVALGWSF